MPADVSPETDLSERLAAALAECREVAIAEIAFVDVIRDEVVEVLRTASDELARDARLSGDADLLADTEVVLSAIRQAPEDAVRRFLAEEAEAARRRARELDDFTVALHGRTMAGKSTLAEALVRGDGASIGDGGQNTTKAAQPLAWNGLRVVDCPGIGGWRGETERAEAHEVVSRADVVVFVLSDDSIPAEVLEEVGQVRDMGKPMVFVLNVKQALDEAFVRELWLSDPDVEFEDAGVSELADDLRNELARRFGLTTVPLLHLHAWSTFREARGDRDLAPLGRLELLETAIAEQATSHGPARRIRNVVDGASAAIERQLHELGEHERILGEQLAVVRRAHDRLERRLGELGTEGLDEFRREVVQAYGRYTDGLSEWLDGHIDLSEEKLRAAWRRRHESIHVARDLERLQLEVVDRVRTVADEYLGDVEQDLGATSAGQAAHGPRAYRPGVNWARGLRLLGTAVGVGVALATTAPAWVPWAAAGAGILFDTGASRLSKRRRSRHARRAEALRAQERELRERIDVAAAKHADELVDHLRAVLGFDDRGRVVHDGAGLASRSVNTSAAVVRTIESSRDALWRMGAALRGVQSRCDRRLVAGLLTEGEQTLEEVRRRRGAYVALRGGIAPRALERLAADLDEMVVQFWPPLEPYVTPRPATTPIDRVRAEVRW